MQKIMELSKTMVQTAEIQPTLLEKMKQVNEQWSYSDTTPSLPALMDIFEEATIELDRTIRHLEEVRADNARLAQIARY